MTLETGVTHSDRREQTPLNVLMKLAPFVRGITNELHNNNIIIVEGCGC